MLKKSSNSLNRNKLSVKGHKKILNAIKDGDSKAANNLMAGHLQAIRELVISTNNPNPDKPEP